jgi:hypothetical protein
MDLGEIGPEGAEWMNLVQDSDLWRTLVNTAMNLRVLYKAGNLTSWVTISFLKTPLHESVVTSH